MTAPWLKKVFPLIIPYWIFQIQIIHFASQIYIISGDADVLLSMLVSFCFPFRFFSVVCYPSDPWYIRWFPCFLRWIISLIISPCGNPCAVREWRGVGGGERLNEWCGGVLWFMSKVKLVRNLMCQPDSWFRISVELPVLQGTGESRSSEHVCVRYCNRAFDSTVYTNPYAWNGLVHFICIGLTRLCNYDPGFPPLHSI